MSDASGFWDRLADSYARQPIADENAYRRKLEITQRHFRPDSEVLEFGCGTGTTAIHHAPRVARIRAIDISPRMIAIAREKAEAAGVANVDFEVGTLEALAARAESFDVVLGMSILHLVPDRAGAIARVFRLLRPGGVFASSTACLGGSPLALIRFVQPLGEALGLLPRHLSVFTADELRREMTGAGFVIEHDWRPAPRSALFLLARKPA